MKFAQSFPLSINGLMQMRQSAVLSPDLPGQAYLFQGPEVSELARLRGENSPALLDQITKMMHNVFSIFGDDMKDEYDWDREIDEHQLEEEMTSYAESYMYDFNFAGDPDKMWSMVGFLSSPEEPTTNDPATPGAAAEEPDDESLREVIKNAIGSGIPDAENFKKLYDELKVAERSVVKYYQSQRQYGDAMEFDSNSVIQAWQEGMTQERDGYDGSEIFEDALAAFTSEILQAIVDSKDSGSYYHNAQGVQVEPEFLEEELPKWLPENDFYEELRQHDRAISWYVDEHKDGYGGLQEFVSESIGERDSENFNEQKNEWEHKFGFDIIEYLAPDYDPENEDDLRRDVSLAQISEIAQTIATEGYLVDGGVEAAQKASAVIFAVKELANQDETLKFVFSHDLNMMTWDSDDIVRGIEGLARENNEFLFGPLADQVAQMRQSIEEQRAMAAEQRAAAEEQQRQEQVARYEEQQRAEDAKHQLLPSRQEVTTPEQLQQMQDLGIAKRPFGHETQLRRGRFPGAGYMSMEGMSPFTMSIAPTKDYVGKDKIPPELLQQTLLHGVSTEGQPALGWVGGYADYKNKVLYIAEVQSDLMQRTGHMRDPEKVQKQRKQQVATIQQQIAGTQSKIQNAVSPKQQITQKLDAIQQENEGLQPGDPKIQRNQGILDNLLRQLSNVPDVVDTKNLEFTLQNLNKSLADAQQNLQESTNAEDATTSFTSKYRPWHDYKSKVENAFKEWIPIFFNSAFRLARDKEYAIVRIITSDNLMELWDKYARPETKILFERVYDQTAKFYGAQQVNVQGKTWWEVKMTPDLRIANWLQRLTKTAQAQHQWLVQDPNTGKPIWQVHLDVYFQEMQKEAPELMGEQWEAQETDYADNEGKRSVFQMWLGQVPPELKMGDDLEPNFKQAVREYLSQTQGFDPYYFEESQEQTNDAAIPSADELNEWFT